MAVDSKKVGIWAWDDLWWCSFFSRLWGSVVAARSSVAEYAQTLGTIVIEHV